jgi:sulfur-carrier protein
MRFVYFASVRETIGMDGEQRECPDTVITISDCIDWLSSLGDNYAQAFANRQNLRFAVDQQMAKVTVPLSGVKELAIFPPVTGG